MDNDDDAPLGNLGENTDVDWQQISKAVNSSQKVTEAYNFDSASDAEKTPAQGPVKIVTAEPVKILTAVPPAPAPKQGSDAPKPEPDRDECDKAAKELGCSVEEIIEICGILDKGPKELPEIMRRLNVNIKKLTKLGNELTPSCVAVKFAFETPSRGDDMCGALCVLFDGKRGETVDETYWVYHGKLPTGFNAANDWESFRTAMGNMGGEFENSFFERLRPYVRSVLTRSMLLNFSKRDSKDLRDHFITDLVSGLAPRLLPRRPIYTFDVEHISDARLAVSGFSKKGGGKGAKDADEGDDLHVACMAQVDALSGKAARDIVKGDYIWVDLMDGPGMTGVVYRLLNKLNIEPLFRVESVRELSTGMLSIRFPISNDVTGSVRVLPEVRIRVETEPPSKGLFEWIANKFTKDPAIIHTAVLLTAGLLLGGAMFYVLSLFVR